MIYIFNEDFLNEDWHYLCKRIKRERAAKIRDYAEKYIHPMFENYPELKGKVYLALRKEGWFAEYKPVLHIIIREEDIDNASEWKIRSTTAHEMMHLVQFSNGIGVGTPGNNLQEELQATFHTFARGYAYDFLKGYTTVCKKSICDRATKFGYFYCSRVFKNCCKTYSNDELKKMAKKLEDLAVGYSLFDKLDYNKLIEDCMVKV